MAALSHGSITARLERGEIFARGTWDAGNIRGASYDLRIANDMLIIPAHGRGGHERIPRGTIHRHPVKLAPGEVALVSTVERVCLPWDLTAHISVKFTYSRQGVLVLGGMIVDPGFGYVEDPAGEWAPSGDERLHFIVANVGLNDHIINLNTQRIAAMTFFELDHPAPRRMITSTQNVELDFFRGDGMKGGLALFEAQQTHLTLSDRKQSKLAKKVGNLEIAINSVSRATDQVVVFGIFLLAVTLLVALLVVGLQTLASDKAIDLVQRFHDALPATWPGTVAFVALLGTLLLTCMTVARWSVRTRHGARPREDKRRSRKNRVDAEGPVSEPVRAETDVSRGDGM